MITKDTRLHLAILNGILKPCPFSHSNYINDTSHGLQMPREEIAFPARPKIQSQFQIFRYDRSIF